MQSTTTVPSSSSGSLQQSVTACTIAIAVAAAVGFRQVVERFADAVDAEAAATFDPPFGDAVGDEDQP